MRPRPPGLRIRPARRADVDDLLRIEERAFATDRIPGRSFHRFVASSSCTLLVAVREGTLVGYALVLFRAKAAVARLYSIATAPEASRRGIGSALLAAAEKATSARERPVLRLEVHEKNAAAMSADGLTVNGQGLQSILRQGQAPGGGPDRPAPPARRRS